MIVLALCVSELEAYSCGTIFDSLLGDECLQCFDAVGWVAGRASGLW